jgi:hypothetical protein
MVGQAIDRRLELLILANGHDAHAATEQQGQHGCNADAQAGLACRKPDDPADDNTKDKANEVFHWKSTPFQYSKASFQSRSPVLKRRPES